MSGTGQFRQPRNGHRRSTAGVVQEHLGDRLAAFVDGELCHDTRERVLSHLATCDACRAEADEQRRLKNAVADSLPPALSAGLLARLQGLPAAGPDSPGGPDAGPPFAFSGRPAFGSRPPFGFPDPAGPAAPDGPGGGLFSSRPAAAFLGRDGAAAGFPIHEFGRVPSRGRRFAFAAAGAFSLAALALAAALPLEGAFDASGAEPAPGAASTPVSMSRAVAPRDGVPVGGPVPVPVNVNQPLLSPRGGRVAVNLPASGTPGGPGTPSAVAPASTTPALPAATGHGSGSGSGPGGEGSGASGPGGSGSAGGHGSDGAGSGGSGQDAGTQVPAHLSPPLPVGTPGHIAHSLTPTPLPLTATPTGAHPAPAPPR